MYRIEACPCCRSVDLDSRHAIVAPFLAHYAVGRAPFRCSLLECRQCSFRFFDTRLTPEEVDRLYARYRGEEYFKERHRYEFWYSQRVNDGIAGDPREVEARCSSLETFLGPYINAAEIETVLDYGGDRGQFIPQAVGKKKYVFELSDAVPVPGVARIGSQAELNQARFDLITASGVLEHCSDPCAVLQGLKPLARGPQSLFHFAVPYERYGLRFVGNGKLYGWYLDALLRFEPALILVDLYSTIARVRWNSIPPLGLVKCHEHLNFYNEKSAEALMRSAGLEVVGCSTVAMATYPVGAASLNVLARLASTREPSSADPCETKTFREFDVAVPS